MYLLGKNKNHLSWSSYDLWKKSKDTYRHRYYEDGEGFSTEETRFGNRVATLLEKKDHSVKHIPAYQFPEYKILLPFKEIELLGFIDSFSLRRKAFKEYKTSRTTKWNDLTVARHDQLVFYSLLIELKFGKVENKCELICIPTTKEPVIYKGREYETGIRMSGKIKRFPRTIEQWERDKLKRDLIKVKNEIKKDYKEYRERTGNNKIPF